MQRCAVFDYPELDNSSGWGGALRGKFCFCNGMEAVAGGAVAWVRSGRRSGVAGSGLLARPIGVRALGNGLLLGFIVAWSLTPRVASSTPQSTPKPTIFEELAGTWDWTGIRGSCRDNPHTISFSADQQFLTLTYPRPFKPAAELQVDPDRPAEVRYEVRENSSKAIRVFMVQPAETRRTDAGELVVWDLILVSRDTYRWRRLDWPASTSTRDVVRCRGK